MNYFPPSPRLTNILIVIYCTGLIVTALLLQQILGLHPCPLCVTQRICVIAVGVIAMVAAVHNPAVNGIKIYALLQSAAAILGIAVAGRHVWIQHLPADQVPACGPGLQYMFANFPFTQALGLLLRGDGNCAVVDWTFLGLSIPEWVLINCAVLLSVNTWQLVRR